MADSTPSPALKLTQRTISVLIGEEKKSVSMMTTGAWGIHPEITEIKGPRKRWVITFIPTGGVLGKYPSKKTAISVLGLILSLLPELHHTRDKSKVLKHRALLQAAKGIGALNRYVAGHPQAPPPPVGGRGMLPVSEIKWSRSVNWDLVDERVAEFNAALKQVQSSQVDRRLLASMATSHLNMTSTPFTYWIRSFWGDGAVRGLDDLEAAIREHAQELIDQYPADLDQGLVQGLSETMEAYAQRVSGYIEQAGPEHLTYQGFKIGNPDRMPDTIIQKMLGGLDYLIGLFKRRGVSAILGDTVKTIILRFREVGEKALGWYHADNRAITIMADTLAEGKGRLLERWLDEALVHEIGHHVHLHLLPPEARVAWDKGWDVVEQHAKLLLKMETVQPEERRRFWDLLVRAGGDFGKVEQGLDDLGKLKFTAWSSSHWPEAVQEKFREFMQDSETYIRENLEAAVGLVPPEWQAKELAQGIPYLIQRQMLVFQNQARAAPTDTKAGPMVQPWLVQKYREEHPTDGAGGVMALGIPTDYGRTNEKEDFAETFVWFLVAPEKLSETALYRMKRALSLAGFYGKPIMRVARRWLASSRALASL